MYLAEIEGRFVVYVEYNVNIQYRDYACKSCVPTNLRKYSKPFAVVLTE